MFSVVKKLTTGDHRGSPETQSLGGAVAAVNRCATQEQHYISLLSVVKRFGTSNYFITPRCAMPMLSRVVFLTRYIISSA